MTQPPKLTPRLLAASRLVRNGSFVADIGTDHAYLPISLALNGKIRGAVASDINDGPIARASENIKALGLSDKIKTEKSDGLDKIQSYAPDDILILGMGGELIARILSDAPWTKNPNIRLCLQPMTHSEALRDFLCTNGYKITDEVLIREGERIYQLICAQWQDTPSEPFSSAELLIGKINIARAAPELELLIKKQMTSLQKQIKGKRSGKGEDAFEEIALFEELEKILNKI